jgi:uncharacterized membrane protein YeaQ/YmgE (transglycosylase-associated protein family)
MPLWLKHCLAWLLWVGSGLLCGFIAAAAVHEHGSFGYVILAVAVGLLGAVTTSALLSWKVLGRMSGGARIALMVVVSTAPIAAFSLAGVLVKATYSLVSALSFYWPFAFGAVIVALLANATVLRGGANAT